MSGSASTVWSLPLTLRVNFWAMMLPSHDGKSARVVQSQSNENRCRRGPDRAFQSEILIASNHGIVAGLVPATPNFEAQSRNSRAAGQAGHDDKRQVGQT